MRAVEMERTFGLWTLVIKLLLIATSIYFSTAGFNGGDTGGVVKYVIAIQQFPPEDEIKQAIRERRPPPEPLVQGSATLVTFNKDDKYSRIAVTAAHVICEWDKNVRKRHLMAVIEKYHHFMDFPLPGRKVGIEKVKCHTSRIGHFHDGKFSDFAVIILREPLSVLEFGAILLEPADKFRMEDLENCTVHGWGAEAIHKVKSDPWQVTSYVYSSEIKFFQIQIHPDLGFRERDGSILTCDKFKKDPKDTTILCTKCIGPKVPCTPAEGDSGGGLTCYDRVHKVRRYLGALSHGTVDRDLYEQVAERFFQVFANALDKNNFLAIKSVYTQHPVVLSAEIP